MGPRESQDFNAGVTLPIAWSLRTKTQHFLFQQQEFIEVFFTPPSPGPKGPCFQRRLVSSGQSCQRRTQSKADHTDGEKTGATSQFDNRCGNIFQATAPRLRLRYCLKNHHNRSSQIAEQEIRPQQDGQQDDARHDAS